MRRDCARPGRRFQWHAVLLGATLAGCVEVPLQPMGEVFFDDFSEPDLAALRQANWSIRSAQGHPGIPGAQWGELGLDLIDDPQLPGNRMLRLRARTEGSVASTAQVQVCHLRRYFEGTYAARVRFTDDPVQGPKGDVVVQTFYAVAPLRFDFDPEYSELDWEYLPNGGWGDARTRLYGISWQTARIEPWLAFNQAHQEFSSMQGWHILLMQVAGGRVRMFLDGAEVAEAGGRNYPVVPMSINFSVWFSPGGLLPGTTSLRMYEQDVDWVLHARDQILSPAQVQSRVEQFRRDGIGYRDSIKPAATSLASPCNL